ncbi:DMT family transporter [Vibrio rarus]|uniref:DMT family transporter n=1 Tax=Vibrio rarus TaxID=413403 RepID=UPI0021C3F21A|nr:DMT family transporter [Vibrio rarus]
MRILLLTLLAMIAFAANSLLSRLALVDGAISAELFTVIRLVSGATTLTLILLLTQGRRVFYSQWKSACYSGVSLFLYALLFSIAYTRLTTGAGALILFGAVQFSLLGAHLIQGYRFRTLEWVGIGISCCGFISLVGPSSSFLSIWPVLCMLISGLSWASFTLLAKQSQSALPATTKGFIMASLLSLTLIPWLFDSGSFNTKAMMYAILSGAITSGLGYVLWYAVVPKISLLSASLSQLLVPAIAMLMGCVFLQEALDLHSITSMLLILGGIALTLYQQHASQSLKD